VGAERRLNVDVMILLQSMEAGYVSFISDADDLSIAAAVR
jgi:hypothetical protein